MHPDESIEIAMTAILEAADFTALTRALHIYAFHQNDDIISDKDQEDPYLKPCVVVEFQSGGESFPQSGNYVGSLLITVQAIASDTKKTDFKALADAVFAVAYTDDLPTRLNASAVTAAVEMTCFGFAGETQASHGNDGRLWFSSLAIPLCVCSKVIA